jgi:hypothetical protein
MIHHRIAVVLILAGVALSACSDAVETFPTGAFQWKTSQYYEFFEDGTWIGGSVQDEPMLQGQYTVDGNMITWHSESMIDGSAGGCGNEGTYTWAYVDKVLSFERVDDTCGPRFWNIDGRDFVLIEE